MWRRGPLFFGYCVLFSSVSVLIASCKSSSLFVDIQDRFHPIEMKSYSIRVPPGVGWRRAREHGTDVFGTFDVLFARTERDSAHSYYALVGELPLPLQFGSPQEFLEYLTNSLHARLDKNRYLLQDETILLDDRFGEYSVRYCRIVEDYGPPGRSFGEGLIVHTCGYVFFHPFTPDLVIRIEYSERAAPKQVNGRFEQISREFNSNANDFFSGLVLKGP